MPVVTVCQEMSHDDFMARLQNPDVKVDHGKKRLGKSMPVFSDKTPRLSDHVGEIAVPATVDWYSDIIVWGMDLNDQISDCTLAGVNHMMINWTTRAKAVASCMTLGEILYCYEQVSGYKPGKPDTDNGAVEKTVLDFWISPGIIIPSGNTTRRDQIHGYASYSPASQYFHQLAVSIFGGSYIGLALPITAQTQNVWSVTDPKLAGNAAPGSWGGHAVPILGYDATYAYVVTWGAVKAVEWAFLYAYCDEAYAIVSHDWINNNWQAPEGLYWKDLLADITDFKVSIIASVAKSGASETTYDDYLGMVQELLRNMPVTVPGPNVPPGAYTGPYTRGPKSIDYILYNLAPTTEAKT